LLRPTTTERQGALEATTTTNAADLALEQAASSSGMSTRSLVAVIITGLLAVALVLSVLTVRYVRATQPHGRFMA
jgi:hypothetical protein